MLPALPPGSLIVATGFYMHLKKGDLVIFKHQGLDKIKRIEATRDLTFYVLGDNSANSSDSRVFGWLPTSAVKAKVIWPRNRG
jgi:hypothetical protein